MYVKELFVVLSLYAANAFGITVDSRFVYPAGVDNLPDYITPATRKILTNRPPKSILTGGEDGTNLRYVLVFKPSNHNFRPEPKFVDPNENKSKAALRETHHPVRVPESYLPKFRPESSQADITREEHAITTFKTKNRGNPTLYKQASSNHRPELQLPKSIVTANLERLINKGPAIQEDKENDSRIIYQAHGFAGPKTYKFGYDTGRGKDGHFHDEERLSSGHVKGHYGYVNPIGRTTVVKYAAGPETGFRIEKIL